MHSPPRPQYQGTGIDRRVLTRTVQFTRSGVHRRAMSIRRFSITHFSTRHLSITNLSITNRSIANLTIKVAGLIGLSLALSTPGYAETFSVTTAAELRVALQAAQSNGTFDTIVLQPGLY